MSSFVRRLVRPLARFLRMLLVAVSGMAPLYRPPSFPDEDPSAEVVVEERE